MPRSLQPVSRAARGAYQAWVGEVVELVGPRRRRARDTVAILRMLERTGWRGNVKAVGFGAGTVARHMEHSPAIRVRTVEQNPGVAANFEERMDELMAMLEDDDATTPGRLTIDFRRRRTTITAEPYPHTPPFTLVVLGAPSIRDASGHDLAIPPTFGGGQEGRTSD